MVRSAIQRRCQYVSQLPIPTATAAEQAAIAARVESILAAKAGDVAADVAALEREIDELVYALYALTPAEIALVEGASNSSHDVVTLTNFGDQMRESNVGYT